MGVFGLWAADIEAADYASFVSGIKCVDYVAPFRNRHLRRLFRQQSYEALREPRFDWNDCLQFFQEEVGFLKIIDHQSSLARRGPSFERGGLGCIQLCLEKSGRSCNSTRRGSCHAQG